MDGDYMLIISNTDGNGISHVVLKNFKLSICWVMVLLLSKNKTTLAFDIESEKKLQQKFNSKMYLKGYLTETSNINFIKFILQNSDIVKKYLDKDDFKEIDYKYNNETKYKNRINPYPYLIEINEKKYFNVYEIYKRKSELFYNLNENDKSIL